VRDRFSGSVLERLDHDAITDEDEEATLPHYGLKNMKNRRPAHAPLRSNRQTGGKFCSLDNDVRL
jgi:hypothetical protein